MLKMTFVVIFGFDFTQPSQFHWNRITQMCTLVQRAICHVICLEVWQRKTVDVENILKTVTYTLALE